MADMADTTTPEQMVSYEELAELEKDFDDVETEIICKQTILQTPLFEKRSSLIAKIPNFWPLVLEQAPPDIDQFIQPSDSTILTDSLENIDITRFEVPPAAPNGTGNPRSVSIRFEFSQNGWFEDKVLEKKFWFRRTDDGWSGLVSDPVLIHWKKGKDLTHGLTDAAYRAWEAEQKSSAATNGSQTGAKGKGPAKRLPEQKVVIKKMEKVSEGSLSFFAWFGFRGRHITAEESAAATTKEEERRARIAKGETLPAEEEEPRCEAAAETERLMEVFPAGEDLAMAISEDLYPGALKYFTQAQEDEAMSDMDFEEDDDDEPETLVDIREMVKDGGDMDEDKSEDEDERPKKKVKA